MKIFIPRLKKEFIIVLSGKGFFISLLALMTSSCFHRTSFSVNMFSGQHMISIPSLNSNEFELVKEMKEEGHSLFENKADSIVILVHEFQSEDEISKVIDEDYYFPNVIESDSLFEIGLNFKGNQNIIEIEKLVFIRYSGKNNYPNGYVITYKYSNIMKNRRVDVEIRKILGDFDLIGALEWANSFTGIKVH